MSNVRAPFLRNRKENGLSRGDSALYIEGGHAGVNGACTQIFFNAEQLVVCQRARCGWGHRS